MPNSQIKKHLLEMKSEIEQRLQRTHRHIHQKDQAVSANFHDQVKETENDQLVYVLDEEGRYELEQINRALSRLERGEYFICSKCGKDINPARLEAVPYTEFCINCA